MPKDCVFCDALLTTASSEAFTVYENDLVKASHAVREDGPSYLGHLALQSRRHVPGYAELTDDEAMAIGLATVRLSRALKACTRAEKIYVVTFAEVVPHLHTFLTSRYSETPQEYWRMDIQDWPDAPRGDGEAVAALCECLRSAGEPTPDSRSLESTDPHGRH